ncbi:MAG: type I-E CRISPR-associated protein Cse2/CasB [Oscillochloridaceae bacterium]|nr:type I-E CRISPR-associated protein Cse2/CasB [Chloroflexaceae bacterium]MDW8389517.1 type I-E CRISPR-associated protein Cse2/CasB [Oscillochloridaceae bacterium]
MSEPTPRQQQVAAFIAALERLDNAGRARLKRNAGRALHEARDVQRVFVQALPPAIAGRPEEEIYFLVATLYPLAKARDDGASLGATLRAVRQLRGNESLDRRFQALLDSDAEQLRFRARQAVRLAAASEQRIDWGRLLSDLLAWEHPDRYVQLRWARDYFVGQPATVSS